MKKEPTEWERREFIPLSEMRKLPPERLDDPWWSTSILDLIEKIRSLKSDV